MLRPMPDWIPVSESQGGAAPETLSTDVSAPAAAPRRGLRVRRVKCSTIEPGGGQNRRVHSFRSRCEITLLRLRLHLPIHPFRVLRRVDDPHQDIVLDRVRQKLAQPLQVAGKIVEAIPSGTYSHPPLRIRFEQRRPRQYRAARTHRAPLFIDCGTEPLKRGARWRSEEHTSELQSRQ